MSLKSWKSFLTLGLHQKLCAMKVKDDYNCDEGQKMITIAFLLGCALIDSFTLSTANLGAVDIRHLDKDGLSLQDQIQSFLSSAVSFSEDKQQLKINFLLGKIKENSKKLDELLSKPWNCELRDAGIIEKKIEVGGGDEHIFKLATPLKEKASCSCEDCSYSVSNHVVFKRHVKAKHGKIIKVDAPKVTCMLPHRQGGTRVTDRHTMDQICSHLKQVCFFIYQHNLM